MIPTVEQGQILDCEHVKSLYMCKSFENPLAILFLSVISTYVKSCNKLTKLLKPFLGMGVGCGGISISHISAIYQSFITHTSVRKSESVSDGYTNRQGLVLREA